MVEVEVKSPSANKQQCSAIMAAVRERARSQSLATSTSETSCSEASDSSEASSTSSSSYRNDRGMTNGRGVAGATSTKSFLSAPSVTATVKIKLSPSRAIITDTDVSATVCPNATVKKPAPAPFTPVVTAVIAPKVLSKQQPVQLTTSATIRTKAPSTPVVNSNKFTPTTTTTKPTVTVTKQQSTEEESSDPLDSDLSEADVEEIEEEEATDDDEDEDEEDGDEDESEAEDVTSNKIGGENVVRQRKEYELDDFQMIKTIGESEE